MKLEILKTIIGTKTNFSILSMIHIDGNLATATNMEAEVKIKLPICLQKGCYTWDSLQLALAGHNIKPDTSDSEYPDVPDLVEVENPVKLQTAWIAALSKYMSKDSSQYTLNGWYYTGAELVAIDGRQMIYMPLHDGVKREGRIITNIAPYVSHFSKYINLITQDNKEYFYDKDGFLSVPLLSGKFPNYQIFLPKQQGDLLEVNFNLLRKGLEKLRPFIDESNKVICMVDRNSLYLSVHNAELNNIPTFSLPCLFPLQNITIGLNLLMFLNILENENKIYINSAKAPILITDGKIKKVIMPMVTDNFEKPKKSTPLVAGGFL